MSPENMCFIVEPALKKYFENVSETILPFAIRPRFFILFKIYKNKKHLFSALRWKL
jgi:hypothetical protein